MNKNEILFIEAKKIPDMVYKGDLTIRKIFIGKNVSSVGAEAFSMCPNLESIEVDEGNEWFTSGKGSNAIIEKASGILLVGCYKTEIPDFVTEIGPFAFCGQTKLKKITIPSHVYKVGAYAFDGCSELAELRIEKGVEYIEEYCFKDCMKFEKMYLPNTKINIDATIFGVTPFDWDDMETSLREWEEEPHITPHFEGILNIFFDGEWEEYSVNGDFVEQYMSCSLIEKTHVIYVYCKDVKLIYNKWNFCV